MSPFCPPASLLLFFLASCKAEEKTADSGCGVPEEEIPYDGIDQDCDGTDLTDVDGDGFDSTAVTGGDDCDDEDEQVYPGASETPYDGIDQDCDGADLSDVDGDGYEAEEAGGPDCDDADAAVNPGATEDSADGLDNDCDGRIDEHLVCGDGSGEHTTIAGAIDAAAAGSTLELCPGTYTEDFDISASINIEGGGSQPSDVLILSAGTQNRHVGVSGMGTEARFHHLAMRADNEDQRAFVVWDEALVELDTLDFDFCSGGTEYEEIICGSETGTRLSAVIERSYFCSAFSNGTPRIYIFSKGVTNDLVFSKNIVVNTDSAVQHRIDSYYDTTIRIANNLVVGGQFMVSIYEPEGVQPEAIVSNNTIVDLADFWLAMALSSTACSGSGAIPSFRIDDNIFSSITPASRAIWYAVIFGSTLDLHLLSPTTFSTNILWDISGDVAEVSAFESCDGQNLDSDTTEVSSQLESYSILADPLFTVDAARGSYALDASSPAVDAGSGLPDADGTPNDIGAFGGPGGAW